MKYIIILVLVLAGVLFFTKDKLFSNVDNSFATVIRSIKKVGQRAVSTPINNQNINPVQGSGDFSSYYTLKADAGLGGKVSGKTGKFRAGTKVTINAISNAGYVFDDWDGDNDSCFKKESCTVTMDEDKYLTASFKPVIRIQDPNKCYAFINKLFTGGSQKNFEQESLSIINNPNLSKTEKDQKLKKLLKKYLPFGVPDKDKFEICIGFHYEWPW